MKFVMLAVFFTLFPMQSADASCARGSSDVIISLPYDRTDAAHVELLRRTVASTPRGTRPWLPTPRQMTPEQLEAAYLVMSFCPTVVRSTVVAWTACPRIVVMVVATFPNAAFCGRARGTAPPLSAAWPDSIRLIGLEGAR